MKALLPNDSRYKRLESEIYGKVCRFFAIVTASVLTDKLGLNGVKTGQVLEQIQDRADSINSGYASLEDFETVLNEEYGITFFDGGKK